MPAHQRFDRRPRWPLLALLAFAAVVPNETWAQRGDGDDELLTAQSPASGPAPAPTRPTLPSGSPQRAPVSRAPLLAPLEAPPLTGPRSTVPSTSAPGFRLLGVLRPTPALTFELHPSLTVSEEYTDNFDLRARDTRENFRTSLSPGLALLLNAAFTKGLIDYRFTAAHDTADNDVEFFHDLTSMVSWQASPRLTLTASDTLTRSDSPSRADELTLRRERATFTSNTFSLQSDYLIANVATQEYYRLETFFDDTGPATIAHTLGATATTSFYRTNTVSVGYEYLRSDTSQGGSDVRGHEVFASLARELTPRASVGVSGSYAWRDVSAVEAGEATAYTIGSVALFGGYALPGTWSVTTSLGYSWLHPNIGASESSITTSTTLAYEFARALLSLTGDAGFSETFARGENFGVVRTYGVRLSLSYPFTPFVTGMGTVFYERNKFTNVAGTESGRARTGETDDAWGGSLGLAIQLLRWLTLELEYGYTNAGSSVPEREYAENRARASLTATF